MVLRYNTEDVVDSLAGPFTCRLRDWPATSDIQGKLRLSVRHDRGWTYPRDVLEALEAVEEDVPLPARCGFWAVSGGVAVEAVVRAATPLARRQIETALEAQGVPLRELHLVEDRRAVAAAAAAALRPARGFLCHVTASDRSGNPGGRPPRRRKVIARCSRP